MAIEVGSAFVSIIPSARGFGRNLSGQINGDVAEAGRRGGAQLGGALGVGAAGGLAAAFGPAAVAAVGVTGIAGALGSAIAKAGEFDKTIRTVGATTGLTGPQLQGLTDLAIEFGSKTTFSAQGAADAMLELAKGGLTAAQIEAGALRDTLTLAAAGGLELGAAASFMVQGLTTFGLTAEQGGQVAAALAGAANASTASVESIGQALSQVGPSAKLAGLSIQETTAAIAAFDNAGIKGSDAGTSLKTMLSRLVPSTASAATEMSNLGLNFRDAQGNFLPLRDIAQQLQAGLSGLSESQKTTALSTIFGADAFRAAAILAENGAAGIDRLVGATSNVNAATEMAKVGTQGYAGALDAFTGAVETAQIQLGTALLPVATDFLNFLSANIPKLTEFALAVGGLIGPPVLAAFNAASSVVGAFIALFTGSPLEISKAFGLDIGSEGFQSLIVLRDTLSYVKDAVLSVVTSVREGFAAGGVAGAFAALGNSVGLLLPTVTTKLGELATAFIGWIGPMIPGLLTALGQVALSIGTWIIGILPTVATYLGQLALAFINWVGPLLPGLLTALGGLLLTIGQAIVGALPMIGQTLLTLGAAFINWVAPLIPGLLTALGGFLAAAGNWVLSVGLPALIEKVGQWGNALLDWIGPRIPGLIQALGGFLNAAFQWIVSTGLPLLGQAVGMLAGVIVGWIGPRIPDIIAGLYNMLIAIGTWIITTGIPGLLKGAAGLAGGLISGIVDGLIAGGARVVEAIKTSVTDKLPQFVKDALGIQSPSRIFYELGSQVSAGMAQGIISGQRDVTRSVNGLVPTQVRAPRLAGAGAGAPGAGGFGQSSTTSWLSGASITVQAQDPVALQRQLEARARLESLVGAA